MWTRSKSNRLRRSQRHRSTQKWLPKPNAHGLLSEPNSKVRTVDFGDIVGLIATALAALAIMGTGLVWLIRNVVRDEIKKATLTIQPGFRNGGESLADVAAKVDRISEKLGL